MRYVSTRGRAPERAEAAPGRAAALSLDDIVRGLSACREARLAILGNVSPRLSVEILLSRLATAA